MKTINNSEGQGSFPFRNAYPISDYFTIKSDLDKELKMNQEVGTIYIATNLINGKQYVGQTIQKLKERIQGHKGIKKYSIFYKAIKKYGIENFKIISFSCPEEELDWRETFLIKELNTLPPNGYNLETGGHKNKHHHELTKQKMKKFWNEHPEERIKRDEKAKITLNNPKNRKENSNKCKKRWSNFEEREKQSQRMIGKFLGKNHPRARAVILISPKKIEYNLLSYRFFCKKHNLHAGHISQVLKGKLLHHKGWTGKYLEDTNDK